MSSVGATVARTPGLEALNAAGRALEIPRRSRVYVNRNLRLHKIETFGFNMDYTLAIYTQARIEELSMRATLDKLCANKGYPEEIRHLTYDAALAIRGLVVDRMNGNIFKPDRYGFPGRARPGAGGRRDERNHLKACPLRLPRPAPPRVGRSGARPGGLPLPARADAP